MLITLMAGMGWNFSRKDARTRRRNWQRRPAILRPPRSVFFRVHPWLDCALRHKTFGLIICHERPLVAA